MKFRTGLLLLTLLLAAPHSSAAQESAFAKILIELKNGEIEAEYRLASPLERLDLARDSTQYRSVSWRILTAGVSLKDSTLLAASGKTFDRVRVSVKPLDRPAQKDYDPILRFSDGGRAVYTGQFDVARKHGSTAFEFQGSRKMPVALAGVLHHKPVRYAPAGEGTYAYFGRTPLLNLPFGLAIIDPALPAWALAELRSFVPAVLTYYGERLGEQPALHSFILFNYDAGMGAGAGYGGDVLPGLLRLVLYGTGWQDDSEKLRRRLRWTIAHETAHFWNSQKTNDEAAPWMHEGSADALAHLALHDLGFITGEQLAAAQDEALNRCLLELDGRSVNEAFRQGRFRAVYDCGHVMSLLTEAAMRQRDPRLGLHDFWRTLLELAAKDGGFYNQGHYLANLVKQTGDSGAAAFVYSFTNQSLAGIQPLAKAFAEIGRPLSALSGEPGPEIGRALYRELFGHLMAQDCNRHSFDTFDDRIVLNGSAECGTLKESLTVTKLAGFSVYENALAAYAVVAKTCGAGGVVSLGASSPDRTIALPCTKSIPEAPTLMSFKPTPGIGAAVNQEHLAK